MTGGQMDKRKGRYVIAAAVLFLVLLVGAAYLIIMAVRGDDTDTGPTTPVPEVVTLGIAGASG